MQFFLPLVKADEEKRLVYARAAVEERDKAKEIMDYATAVPQFRSWSKQYSDATMGKSYGNVRAMHNPRHLSGKVQELIYNDADKSIECCIKVLDPTDWHKLQEGGYTGISIGGGYAKKWPDPLHKDFTRYTPRITEISFVDSPCIPSATILEMTKSDGSVEEILLKGVPHSFADLVPPRTFVDMTKAFGMPSSKGPGTMGALSTLTPRLKIRKPPGSPIASGVRSGFPGAAPTGTIKVPGMRKILVPLVLGAAGGLAGRYVGRKTGQVVGSGVVHALAMRGARRGNFIDPLHHAVHLNSGHRIGGNTGAYLGTIYGAGTGIGLGLRSDDGRKRLRQKRAREAKKQEILENLRKNYLGVLGAAANPFDSIDGYNARAGVATRRKKKLSVPRVSSLGKALNPYQSGVSTVHHVRSGQSLLGNPSKGESLLWNSPGTTDENGFPVKPRTRKSRLGKADTTEAREKIRQTLHEFKHGGLRSYRGVNPKSGKARKGPKVTDRRQAIAIALSQARRLTG